MNQQAKIVELAGAVGNEWRRILQAGTIYNTTPELRDSLSRLSGEIAYVKDPKYSSQDV